MVSHVADVCRAGLWAAFSGGWYFDTNVGIYSFTNAFHLYLWLFLLCYPLALYLTCGTSATAWSVYATTIAALLLLLKWINYELHAMFDGRRGLLFRARRVDRDRGATNDDEDDVEMKEIERRAEEGEETHPPRPPPPSSDNDDGGEDNTSLSARGGEEATCSNLDRVERHQAKPCKLEFFGRESPSSSNSSHSREGKDSSQGTRISNDSPGASNRDNDGSTKGTLTTEQVNVTVYEEQPVAVESKPGTSTETVQSSQTPAKNDDGDDYDGDDDTIAEDIVDVRPTLFFESKYIDEVEAMTTTTTSGNDVSDAVKRFRDAGLDVELVVRLAGENVEDESAVHFAENQDDTSPGSIHVFTDRDEFQAYMFDESGSGMILDLASFGLSNPTRNRRTQSNVSFTTSDSDLSPSLAFNRRFLSRPFSTHDAPPGEIEPIQTVKSPKYLLRIFPYVTVPITFDRLALLSLMDRNPKLFHLILSIFLGTAVSVLGYWLLYKELYRDFWIFWICLVIASCQYSLVKSLQPDSSSPSHDDKMSWMSRSVYFCVVSSLVLILDAVLATRPDDWSQTRLYGISLFSRPVVVYVKDALAVFLLFLPVVFMLGLLPIVNTFTIYLLEQLNMHTFGGNAVSGLGAAVFGLTSSLVAAGTLYGFAYGAAVKEKPGQAFIFSVFMALLLPLSYQLSRLATSPKPLWMALKSSCSKRKSPAIEGDDAAAAAAAESDDFIDPMLTSVVKAVKERLSSDLFSSLLIAVVAFGVHVSTGFTSLQPALRTSLYILAASLGFIVHYLLPQLRKQLPWLCISNPVLRSAEYDKFEVIDPAKLTWFEWFYALALFLERNFIYPAVFLSGLTIGYGPIVQKFGPGFGAAIITICGLKMMRSGYSRSSQQFVIVSFTVLLFEYDYPCTAPHHSQFCSESFPLDYFFVSIFLVKFHELILKVKFALVYIVPWQIPWGSAFHAFAQPLSVPHSAMLFLQAIVSALVSSPLNPILGSAIFIASYVRPVKFWEKDYNTKRVDHSNTRLSSQLDKDPGGDDNNLNSIFYEHLTYSLQNVLAGDLMLGRWGRYETGDCFILASDNLNALVHIIEVGNGLVTFQIRGLEFRGTYCQQREVEAITEGVDEDGGCCCCSPGHIPRLLSVNAAFGTRWLAWEVTTAKYILKGYSISDNNAASMLQVFDLRKILVTYYVKSILYYAVTSPKISAWLSDPVINEEVFNAFDSRHHKDVDPALNVNTDEDFDVQVGGVSLARFTSIYYNWIEYCAKTACPDVDRSRNSNIVRLCFALSLLGRRALGAAAQHQHVVLESFLYGLHALFKGDFRITSPKDEWVFVDIDLLHKVVARAVRMSLQLYQDHFTSPDEYDDSAVLFDAIRGRDEEVVICHEGDPAWREAVLSNKPSLLSLRHVVNEGTGEYKIIMLNKRFLSFRVVKVNQECVKGLWAGQQQELIFFRNRNPERGSIQNAKQVLRNMINSSCDQPIGYPIYVSPLVTSYSSTHPQLTRITGAPFTARRIRDAFHRVWRRMQHCWAQRRQNQSSGVSSAPVTIAPSPSPRRPRRDVLQSVQSLGGHTPPQLLRQSARRLTSSSTVGGSSAIGSMATVSSKGSGLGGSALEILDSVDEEASVAAAAAANCRQSSGLDIGDCAQIIDTSFVFSNMNLDQRLSLNWPNDEWRAKGGRNGWKDWFPPVGSVGRVVHVWRPFHPDPVCRTILDKTMFLLEIDGRFVPVAEAGLAVQV